MKRCNNCGWFNLDSATHCEKCDEESFDPVEPEESIKSEDPVESAEIPLPKNPMMSTVAMGTGDVAPTAKRNAMAATVLDAAAFMETEISAQCPKCCYPVTGYVEFCPNCGTTIKQNKSQEVQPQQKVQPLKLDSDLKATVRDIPEELMADDSDAFKLVPVGRPGDAVITLHVGDVVTIGGETYRFEK